MRMRGCGPVPPGRLPDATRNHRKLQRRVRSGSGLFWVRHPCNQSALQKFQDELLFVSSHPQPNLRKDEANENHARRHQQTYEWISSYIAGILEQVQEAKDKDWTP